MSSQEKINFSYLNIKNETKTGIHMSKLGFKTSYDSLAKAAFLCRNQRGF